MPFLPSLFISSSNFFKNIEMVLYIFKGTIVGKPLQKSAHFIFYCNHRGSRSFSVPCSRSRGNFS